ncbi:protealysin inhibitor emfourin [Intrasporangium calvum]|uniref:Neutral metalloproteinase n=1 Tax=Intrasporangium calvum (strain ATCC 23552 / DSM 43043 / JCM 3097 / NBRC 12989 / NCIMB 10167 / NRRL B-3866 / 7 KIP) TaxID=710696 RepID=E6SDW5_INTC7|nr:protealysin inhibitor emfourin [Intrasporangium calvum]ADU46568.1 peptidase M4 thermolysin [Intrasporangium calvum DSM 43043]
MHPATESPEPLASEARCSIVPPYILEALARSSEPAVADAARTSLAHDEAIRRARRSGRRLAPPRDVNEPGPPAPSGPQAPTDPTQPTEPTEPSPPLGTGPRRTIGDAQGKRTLPGETVRPEGDPATGDPAVDEAYDGLGATWGLWSAAYGRDSLDDKGMPLIATVHYGQRYDNAFWDGRQMVFGDGDGIVFDRFTKSLDVIGHELAHGVTEHTAGLLYQGQPGALNESVSDVFGVLVKQRALGQTASEADWLVGAELLLPSVQGRALRDMRKPGTAYDDPELGKDPQPAHMDGYVVTDSDFGGVHINSGIPNRAFVLAALAMGGHAWEEAGAIWHAALTGDGIRADCDFARFAELTVAAAAERHGYGSVQHSAVRDAWLEVGVPVGSDEPASSAEADEAAGPPSGPAHGEVPGVDAEVLVRRTGGFAGRVRERTVTIGDLPERDARDWQHLLAAPTLQRIAATAGRSHPDAFCYDVVCPQAHVDVTVAEPHLPEAIHQLLERTLEDG